MSVSPVQRPQCRCEPGLRSWTMLLPGVMIGSGIFIVSADISRVVGFAVL
jgi:hypothetical protein